MINFFRQYRLLPEAPKVRRIYAIVLLVTSLAQIFMQGIDGASITLEQLFGVPTAEAAAGIYAPISYQGKVANTSGVAVANGAYNMRFKIFNTSSGGVPVWTETWSNATQRVTMTGGLFSVLLGTQTAMTGSVDFNNDSLYLQVEFDPANAGTYPEVFSPRRRFASVPYAHNADLLDGLDSTKFVRNDISQVASGTLTIRPKDATKILMDLVSTAGRASTGALRISTQGANHIVFGSGGTNYDTNLYRSAVAALRTDGTFIVAGNMSGASLSVMGGNSYLLGSVGIGKSSAPKAKLDVVGTVSGAQLYASGLLAGSGGLTVKGTIAFRSLTGCTGGLVSDVNGVLSCGSLTGNSFGTGNVITIGDSRYIRKSGGTMTGALTINVTGGIQNTVGLNVINTISGAIIRAQKTLASSGTLVLKKYAGTSTGNILMVDTNGLVYDGTNKRVGVGTSTPKATLDVVGTISGSALTISGLQGCTSLQTSAVGAFSCGSALTQSVADARYLRLSGGTLTGALTINVTGGIQNTVGLNVINTISGAIIRAQKTLASSGTLVLKKYAGTSTGNILMVDTKGLVYDATNKSVGVGTSAPKSTLDVVGTISGSLLTLNSGSAGANYITGNLSIGTTGNAGSATLNVAGTMSGRSLYITGTGSSPLITTAGGRIGINTASMGGVMEINTGVANQIGLIIRDVSSQTANLTEWRRVDNVLLAAIGRDAGGNGQLTLGALKLQTDGSFLIDNGSTAKVRLAPNANDIYMQNTVSSGNMYFSGYNSADLTGNVYFQTRGNVGIGTLTASADLTVSGSTVIGNNIGSRAAKAQLDVVGTISGSALTVSGLQGCASLQTSAIGAFSCGTGLTQTLADARYLKLSGGTLTGALTINVTGGIQNTVGLNVINTISGAIIRAQKTLASSGTLVLKKYAGTATGNILMIDTKGLVYDATNKRVGINTSAPKTALEVTGTVSGSALVINGTSTLNAGVTINMGAASTGLKIQSSSVSSLLTIGETILSSNFNMALANRAINVTDNSDGSSAALYLSSNGAGGVSVDRAIASLQHTALEVAGTISGSALTISGLQGCTSLQTSAAGAFSCGSSLSQTSADARYLRLSGGTLTGALTINVTGGIQNTVGLNVISTISGAIIRAMKTLAASGTLVVKKYAGTSTGNILMVDTNGLVFDASNKRVGVGTASPKTKLEVVGTISGSALSIMAGNSYFLGNVGIGKITTPNTLLEVAGSVSGASLTVSSLRNCDTIDTNAAGVLACGVDAINTFGTGNVITIGNSRYVSKQGGTMTGALVIQNGNSSTFTATPLLNVRGTMSGRSIYISGTGAAPLLMTNTTNGRVGVGTANPSSILHIFDAGGATTLMRLRVEYGGIGDGVAQQLSLKDVPANSESTITNDDANSQLVLNTSYNVLALQTAGTNRITVFNSNVGIGKNVVNPAAQLVVSGSTVIGNNIGTRAAKAQLDVVGTMSGTSLTVSALQNCASIQSSAIGVLSCGSVGSSSFGTGNTITIGDSRYIRKSGGTMTGALAINVTGGIQNTVGLNVINTISGAIIHAQKTLTSSGTFVVTGSGLVKGSLGVGSSYFGAGGVTNNNAYGLTVTSPDNTPYNGLIVYGQNQSQSMSIGWSGMQGTSSLAFNSVGGNLAFQTASTNRMIVFGAGNTYFSNTVGLGTLSPKATLDVVGRMSGSYLTISNLSSCSSLQTSSSGAFACGSSLTQTLADARYLRLSGGTLTGALAIRVTGAIQNTVGLNVSSTISGAIIRAMKTLASSGTLVLKNYAGTSTGNILMVDTKGLVYDATNKRVGVGTSTPSVSFHVVGSGAFSTYLAVGKTFAKATLDVAGTISGSALTVSSFPAGNIPYVAAGGALTTNSNLQWDATNSDVVITGASVPGFKVYNGSAGWYFYNGAGGGANFAMFDITANKDRFVLMADGSIQFGNQYNSPYMYMDATGNFSVGKGIGTIKSKLDVVGTISGSALSIMGGNSYFLGKLGIGKIGTPNTQLEVAGSVSGASLTVSSLRNCDTIDTNAAGVLVCGVDATGGSGSFGTGNVLAIGDSRYIRKAGGIMTGALVIQNGNSSTFTSTPLLNIRGTMSGRSIFISGTGANTLFSTNITTNRVGINTLAPKATLDVVGTLSGSALTISSLTSGRVTFAGAAGSITSDSAFTWDNTNKTLGVGGTASANSYEKMYITGSDNTGNGISNILENTAATGPSNAVFATYIMRTGSSPTNDGVFFGSKATGFSQYGIVNGIAMRPGQSTQDLGLAAGNGVTGSALGPALIIKPDTKILVGDTSSAITSNPLVAQFTIYPTVGTVPGLIIGNQVAQTANLLELRNSSTVRASMSQSGWLAIGKTTQAKTQLDIAGTLSGTALVINGLSTHNGNIVAGRDNAFDLGTNSTRWRHLYLSGGSLHIGSSLMEGKIGYQTNGFEGLQLFGSGGSNATPSMFISSGGLIGIGTSTPKAKFEVFGTISGSSISISSGFTGSGGLTVRGAIAFRTLASCSGGLITDVNGILSCGSLGGAGSSFGSGNVLTIGDRRYVQKQGGTMTGALIIQNGNSPAGNTTALLLSVRGTMSGRSLWVNGTGSSPLFMTKVTNGRVGIGTSTPSETLDVAGDLRLQNYHTHNVTRTIPSAVNDEVDIGSFSTAQGAFSLDMDIVVNQSGTSTAKHYIIPVYYSSTGAAWQTVLPVSSGVYNGGTDFDLEINSNGTTASLRIRRTLGSGTVTAYVTMGQSGLDTDTFTPSTATSTVSAPTVIYTATQLTQIGSQIAIGKATGKALLDVNGTISGASLYIAGSVGINKVTPQAKLDVRGTISGSTIISTVAGFGGNLSPTLPVDILGDFRSTNFRTQNAQRTLPTVVNDEVDIGSFAFTNGGGTLYVDMVVPSASNSFAKQYIIPVQYNATAAAWQTVLPFASTGPFSGNDADLDINVNGSVASLRIRRSLGTTAGTVYVSMKQQGLNTDAFTSSTATSSVSAPTAYYSATMLTQVGSQVGINKIAPKATLDVLGTISGSTIAISNLITGSGGMIVKGSIAFRTLTGCSALQSDSNGILSCGTALTQASGDARYVRQSGGTMTGALAINVTGGIQNTIGLNVINTISGAIIHAQTTLSSSGSLNVTGASYLQGNVTIDGNTLFVDTVGNKVGIGTGAPKTPLEVKGTISGSALTISNLMAGSGGLTVRGSIAFRTLSGCTSIQTDTNGILSCGAGGSGNFGTGNVLTIGNSRYIQKQGGTMTGVLVLQSGNTAGQVATALLNVRGTMSGRTLTLNGSGSRVPALTINKTGTGLAMAISGSVIKQNAYGTPRVMSGMSLLAAAANVVVADRGYAFVGFSNATGNEFQVVDVKNPNAPKVIGGLDFTSASVNSIAIQGHYAYVGLSAAQNGQTLVVVDIANPAVPTIVGGYTSTDGVNKVFVSGKYVYAAFALNNRFRILDFSNQRNATVVGFCAAAKGVNDLFVRGNTAFLGLNSASIEQDIGIGDPTAPTNCPPGGGITTPATDRILVNGNYSYRTAADTVTPLLNLIVRRLDTATDTTINLPQTAVATSNALAIMGHYLLIGYSDSSSATNLAIVDISNPTAAREVGTYSIAFTTAVTSIAVDGKYVYITSNNTSGINFRILDMAGIDAPTATIGVLAATTILTQGDMKVGQSLSVGDGLQVGRGGILSQGDVTIIADGTGTLLNAFDVRSGSGSPLFRVRSDGLVSVTSILSGATIRAQQTLASSGTFILKKRAGTATGNILMVDTKGLVYDGTNRRVGINTSTPKSTLDVVGTASGSVLFASSELRSSGSLIVRGASNLQGNLTVDGNTMFVDTVANRVGINNSTPKSALDVVGTISGSALTISNLQSPNGMLYATAGGAVAQLAPGGVGTFCLVETNGGTPVWSSCGGSASTAWSALSNPSGNTALSMTSNTTSFTWGNAVTSGNLFSLTDTASDTGTGNMLNVATAAGSRVSPLRIKAGNKEALFVSSGAFIGIGTLAPRTQLAVSGSVVISANGTSIANRTAKAALDVVGTISGSALNVTGLSNCGALYTNTGGLVSCGGMIIKSKALNQSVTSSTVLVEDATQTFKVKASETWVFQYTAFMFSTSATPGAKFAISAPTGSTCNYAVARVGTTAGAGSGTTGCYRGIDVTIPTASVRTTVFVSGTITVGGTAGSGALRWAQRVSNATAMIMQSGSTMIAFKPVGSDVAEVYRTLDNTVVPGSLVSIDPTNEMNVRRSQKPYDDNLVGVISTKPGQIVGGDDMLTLNGSRVFVALVGRVPVMVSDENGPIHPGDYLTSSSTPGVAMKATRQGPVIGQAMTSFAGPGMGVVTVFVQSGDRHHVGANAESGSVFELKSNSGLTLLHLTNSGNVVIGQGLSGSGKLTVFTDGNFHNPAISIISTTTDPTQDLLKITSAATGTGSATAFRVTAGGDVYAAGAFHTSGADYAEWFRARDKIPLGHAVCLDPTVPNMVKECDRAADPNLIGIRSTKPSVVGNSVQGQTVDLAGLPIPGYELVGLIGQLDSYATVETASGVLLSILPGDSLTSGSKPGYLRKALPGESTVGVALTGLQAGEGTIKVLIARSNKSLTVEAVEQRVSESVAALNVDDQIKASLERTLSGSTFDARITSVVTAQLSALTPIQNRVAALEARLSHLSGSTTVNGVTGADHLTLTGSLNAADITSENTLTVGRDARIGGDLYLDGTLKVNSIVVPGGLQIEGDTKTGKLTAASGSTIEGGFSIQGDLVLGKNLLLASGSTLSAHDLIVRNALTVLGPITINGLAQFLGDVEIKGELTVSSRQAGYARIPLNSTGVYISFTPAFHYTPVITVTPQGRVGSEWWTESVTQSGFLIKIEKPATKDVTFSYIALTVDNPLTASGTAVSSIASGIAFPVDAQGVPVSTSPIWNACIRNQVTIDPTTGQPFSCARYRTDTYTWTHPDFPGLSFVYNDSLTPAMLILPEGYVAQTVQSSSSSDSTTSSSSNSSVSSSESSVSSSSSSDSTTSSSVSSSSSSDSTTSSSSVSTTSSSSQSSTSSSSSSDSGNSSSSSGGSGGGSSSSDGGSSSSL